MQIGCQKWFCIAKIGASESNNREPTPWLLSEVCLCSVSKGRIPALSFPWCNLGELLLTSCAEQTKNLVFRRYSSRPVSVCREPNPQWPEYPVLCVSCRKSNIRIWASAETSREPTPQCWLSVWSKTEKRWCSESKNWASESNEREPTPLFLSMVQYCCSSRVWIPARTVPCSVSSRLVVSTGYSSRPVSVKREPNPQWLEYPVLIWIRIEGKKFRASVKNVGEPTPQYGCSPVAGAEICRCCKRKNIVEQSVWESTPWKSMCGCGPVRKMWEPNPQLQPHDACRLSCTTCVSRVNCSSPERKWNVVVPQQLIALRWERSRLARRNRVKHSPRQSLLLKFDVMTIK